MTRSIQERVIKHKEKKLKNKIRKGARNLHKAHLKTAKKMGLV